MAGNISALAKSISRLTESVNKELKRKWRTVSSSSGEINRPLKEWYGAVTSVNGTYTFNYSNAGFSEILHVSPQAISSSQAAEEQVMATINSVSLTSMTGSVVKGTSFFLRGESVVLAGSVTVMVKVTGY
jgi:hypothetical protein